MPNINYHWTPATGILGQNGFAKDRVSVSWSVAGVPALTATSSTAVFSDAVINKVYQFKVNSLCDQGRTSVDSPIGEGVVFGCFDVGFTDIQQTSITVQANSLHPDITNFKFILSDGTGTSVLQTSVPQAPTGGTLSHTFTGLTANTDYIITYSGAVDLINNSLSSEVYSSPTLSGCSLPVKTGVTVIGAGNCISFKNNTNNTITGDYVDCQGNTVFNQSFGPNAFICARSAPEGMTGTDLCAQGTV